MRILLAGASGVFGRVLTPALLAAGHEVVGVTRSPDGVHVIEGMGAGAVIADVLNRDQLLAAVAGQHFDAVISQLTALKKPPMRNKDMDVTNTLRTVGTENLMAAAKATGATRFLTQSMIFGYGYGDLGPAPITEDAFFGPSPRRSFARHGEAMLRNEQIAFSEPGIDGMALRYGLFYGARPPTTTWTSSRPASSRSSRPAPTPSSTSPTRRARPSPPWSAARAARRTTSWTTPRRRSRTWHWKSQRPSTRRPRAPSRPG